MSLCLDDLRSIRASLFHSFDKRFGVPPAHHLATALHNLEAEIARLERIEKVTRQMLAEEDERKVVSIEVARTKRHLD